MILIGFIGHSGSGKSTLAREMEKICKNSRHIDGDLYMYKTFSHFKDLTDEMWGNEIYNSKGEITFSCVITGGEKGKKFANMVWPWVNEQFEKEIEMAENDGIECLIFDWSGLPYVDVWKKWMLRFL